MQKHIALLFVLMIFGCSGGKKEFKTQEEKVSVLADAPYSLASNFSEIENTEGTFEILEYNLDNYANKGILLSSLSKNSTYISLESGQDHLIGEISDLIKTEDSWIIVDSKISKSVFSFDEDGSFISRVGKNGQGPGEYLNPTNVSYSDESYFIHSEFQGRIFEYDKEGFFKRDFLVPFLFDDFHFINDHFYFNTFNRINGHITAISNNMVLSTDKNLSIENSAFYFDPELYMKIRAGYGKRLKRKGDELYFIQPFTPSLFTIKTDNFEIEKIAKLDFEGDFVEQDELKGMIDRNPVNIKRQLMDRGYGVIEDYLLNDDYLITKVLYQLRLVYLIQNRKTGKTNGAVAIIDDIDNLNAIAPQFMIDNKLITVLEPESLIETAEKLKATNKDAYEKLLVKIPAIKDLSPTDNFILRIDELK